MTTEERIEHVFLQRWEQPWKLRDAIKEVIEDAIQQEREACAQLAKDYPNVYNIGYYISRDILKRSSAIERSLDQRG